MNKIVKTFQYGETQVTLETGRLARQADGAVLVTMGDTVLLVTVVGKKESGVAQDFFPLTVNYMEKSYAIGRVPGGYFKREGRPTEKETLTSRLVDRSIRPLFPKGFTNEVQVVVTLLSLDPNISADIPAMIGAAAALAVSGIPFNGPLAAARVGYQDGKYLLNPSYNALQESQLNLVVAGTKQAVLMVESEAQQLSEEVMLGAVLFGHQQMQAAIQAIEELASEGGKTSWSWEPPAAKVELEQQILTLAKDQLEEAYRITDRDVRKARLVEVRKTVAEQLCQAEGGPSTGEVLNLMQQMEDQMVRDRILVGEPRLDGRDTTSVRPIAIETGVLPRVHGSAVFTRGETQAIVVATLGTERDAQQIDDLECWDRRDKFILHYNFPPFSVGEIGMMGGPKRREIGHGRLARRALEAVLPTYEEFPYVLRVVSEITESNGSSSMASVCGGSLALMDAGVPLKNPVAGVAMGLIKEGNKYSILTDILGDEDHLGDMDFKVAGTLLGITALQMDIKILGITKEIMERALEQAKQGRLHILNEMSKAVTSSRTELSAYAPKIITIKISPDKVRDVIGKGGVTIREITETTKAGIDITDDGTIKIVAMNDEDANAARRRIEELTTDLEIGKIYEGPITRLMDFGALVSVLPGRQGLVHISQISDERVENINDYLTEGQTVRVKVLEIDRQGRVRLSMKAAKEEQGREEQGKEEPLSN